jgi:membrane protease YdiL (CAAX protease family)
VIGLGFGFALVREWRGSLIPSMTAHCIHNAVTITAVLLVSQLIGP